MTVAGATELVAEEPQPRLDRFLAAAGVLPSRTVAARLARDGAITVNGRPARASRALAAGDRIQVVVPDQVPALPRAEAIALDVVHEDEDMLVVNKPAGMVVHPGAGQLTGTLVNALLARHTDWPTIGDPQRPGIVHRLDKGTSGLMVVARHHDAHRRLSADLAERRVHRVYLAVAKGLVKGPGAIEAPIGRDPRNRQRMAVVEGGRAASTTFDVLESFQAATYLEVTLGSGRTHQIRVHLAAIGHPLVGDATYGSVSGDAGIARPALHAHRLQLRHPRSGQQMEFSVPPPADFTALLEALRSETYGTSEAPPR
ncbi:MAG: RluA family pseudouridine synthase [Candidatus Dormibacteraeota bacterium]|nr:RluA family pseudouridine synthase [Candidatus Dormibacteraeota bacterium]